MCHRKTGAGDMLGKKRTDVITGACHTCTEHRASILCFPTQNVGTRAECLFLVENAKAIKYLEASPDLVLAVFKYQFLQ
jgi:hypothetical protein